MEGADCCNLRVALQCDGVVGPRLQTMHVDFWKAGLKTNY